LMLFLCARVIRVNRERQDEEFCLGSGDGHRTTEGAGRWQCLETEQQANTAGIGPFAAEEEINSLKTKSVRESTREKPATHKISEEGVAQLGASLSFKGPTLYQGAGYPTKFGNELATNVGKGGPGAGRQVHRAGAQGLHGPAVPDPSPRGTQCLEKSSGSLVRNESEG
jgi:hypothetical protein